MGRYGDSGVGVGPGGGWVRGSGTQGECILGMVWSQRGGWVGMGWWGPWVDLRVHRFDSRSCQYFDCFMS